MRERVQSISLQITHGFFLFIFWIDGNDYTPPLSWSLLLFCDPFRKLSGNSELTKKIWMRILLVFSFLSKISKNNTRIILVLFSTAGNNGLVETLRKSLFLQLADDNELLLCYFRWSSKFKCDFLCSRARPTSAWVSDCASDDLDIKLSWMSIYRLIYLAGRLYLKL